MDYYERKKLAQEKIKKMIVSKVINDGINLKMNTLYLDIGMEFGLGKKQVDNFVLLFMKKWDNLIKFETFEYKDGTSGKMIVKVENIPEVDQDE